MLIFFKETVLLHLARETTNVYVIGDTNNRHDTGIVTDFSSGDNFPLAQIKSRFIFTSIQNSR